MLTVALVNSGLSSMRGFLGRVAAGLLCAGMLALPAQAGYFVGDEACSECHEAEHEVWKATKHFESFREVHKKPEAKQILEAAGGSKTLKRNDTCILCHITMSQKDEGDRAKPTSGPSCESCHGAASGWIDVHNDYGGPDVKKAQESPEHRSKRKQQAAEAGMIGPAMTYDIAANCMNCHGLAHADLDADTLGKMLDAEHPLEADFELVKYSQGSVRHRFYPPNVETNAEMTAAELSRLFVAGQLAKLVSATQAASKSSHPAFKTAQSKRAQQAREALAAVASIGAIKAALDAPSEANARAAVAAIDGQDLSAQLGGLLPARADYK